MRRSVLSPPPDARQDWQDLQTLLADPDHPFDRERRAYLLDLRDRLAPKDDPSPLAWCLVAGFMALLVYTLMRVLALVWEWSPELPLFRIVAGAVSLAAAIVTFLALRWNAKHGRIMHKTTAAVGAILLEIVLLIVWIIWSGQFPFIGLGWRIAVGLVLFGILVATVRAVRRAPRAQRREGELAH